MTNNRLPEKNANPKITVEASSIDGIVDALRLQPSETAGTESEDEPFAEEVSAVFETIDDIFRGVRSATADDSRGRSRKTVRQYADRQDMSNETVGHVLRVLEAHGLVVHDGNRWRIAEDVD